MIDSPKTDRLIFRRPDGSEIDVTDSLITIRLGTHPDRAGGLVEVVEGLGHIIARNQVRWRMIRQGHKDRN